MNELTPLNFYLQQIAKGQLHADADQEVVIHSLNKLYYQLIQPDSWLVKLGLKRRNSPTGLYLWGNVGTGKTYLMDNFFHCLPFSEKMRMHFHAFMQVIHTELYEHKGLRNPLQFVAQEFAEKTRVLCLDELIVNDITDAMLLSGLFTALYKEGVCIIFTSNIPPDRLYENGLQREQFLSAISLIKKHSDIVVLNTKIDYRQQYKDHEYNYRTGDNFTITQELEHRFAKLTTGQSVNIQPITIHGRPIKIVRQAQKVIWFDFEAICSVPRSQKDYLTLVHHYDTFLISSLRPIKEDEHDLIRCFINLVDILYDHKILLIIGSTHPIQDIYKAGKYLFPFARTQSRITEMQAENWHL